MASPDRRTLRFETLDDLVADARAVALRPHRATGNWNASQILLHVAGLIAHANRGSELRMPAPVRVLGRAIKLSGVWKRPIPAGIKAPPSLMAQNDANAAVPAEEAFATLEREVAEARARPMSHPSPLLGKLTHEEWVTVHCRHAELHFSFLKPLPAAAPPAP